MTRCVTDFLKLSKCDRVSNLHAALSEQGFSFYDRQDSKFYIRLNCKKYKNIGSYMHRYAHIFARKGKLITLSSLKKIQMREKETEKKFVQAVRKCGGYALKFVSPGFDGMPDRLVLMQGGRICFAEVKAQGRHPRKLQSIRHEMLKRLGFRVFVVDSEEKIQEVLDAVQST